MRLTGLGPLGPILMLLVPCALGATASPATIVEGTLRVGESFTKNIGDGLVFCLTTGDHSWQIEMKHEKGSARDLIYPLTPPYRFSGHLKIGAGYGASARESAQNSPREFAFIHRLEDVERAWKALDLVLWPNGHPEAEVQAAQKLLLEGMSRGTGRLEILSPKFVSRTLEAGQPSTEVIQEFSFRATFRWPKP